MSTFEETKQLIEGLAPNNTILLDAKGRPSFMVRIPKFKISDVIEGGSDAVHPAFIVNGKEVPEIYISKYENVVEDDCAYSLPGKDPATYVTFDQAKAYCENKGKGWHLMSNAEWAAIALWCYKNGFLPRGNTCYGQHHKYPHENGLVTYYAAKKKDGPVRPSRVATGTGPVSWAHNNCSSGIYDLCGNIWEWVSGLRILEGQIQVIPNNDSAAGVDESRDSAAWKAITPAGELVDPSTPGCLYYDSTAAGDAEEKTHDLGGTPIINTARENAQFTDETTDKYFAFNACSYRDLQVKEGVDAPIELLRVLDLLPPEGYEDEGSIFLRNYGERLPIRGGRWSSTKDCGLFSLTLHRARTVSQDNFGFRAAYIEL